MVFSSLVFIFLFLPICLLGYYILPGKFKNLFLLAASLSFYIWGEAQNSFVMLVSILGNFFFASMLEKPDELAPKTTITLAVIFNLGLLIYFKYSNFLLELAGMHAAEKITLPLGISFFTFHALSYIIDVYRKSSQSQKSIVNLGLYITNFPQLVAGPIVRYPEISQQLTERKHSFKKIVTGLKRFIIGLAKKVLIANNLAGAVDYIFAQNLAEAGFLISWIAIITYAMQIYFDFSGYSDMAVGLGKMFGFDFPENFNYPYISKSIKEFWRRWHISLSSWFRDYLYIPMGGNKKGNLRTYFNLITVFLLCGLWHGPNWTFIVWGGWHGAFLILERTSLGNFIERLPSLVKHSYSLIVICIGWVFFRSDSLSIAFSYLKNMFTPELSISENYLIPFRDVDFIMAFIAGLIFSTPVIKSLLQLRRIKFFRENENLRTTADFAGVSVLIILLVLSMLSLIAGTYNPFIYFRF
ncbi:MAG: MBOAT family protein [Sporocytophaga sp.]|uniref:MBOAT family O-acyltransferase n=1 Tax=Sporocytophaga sp. TaxID=2231183 RepID=UPI001B1D76AC|nr:MBOAT family O-acyltransferase [Sporocytophaga sp.]MBO9701991.1 MBOAT family protein [Sporocytophaga sp.]